MDLICLLNKVIHFMFCENSSSMNLFHTNGLWVLCLRISFSMLAIKMLAKAKVYLLP